MFGSVNALDVNHWFQPIHLGGLKQSTVNIFHQRIFSTIDIFCLKYLCTFLAAFHFPGFHKHCDNELWHSGVLFKVQVMTHCYSVLEFTFSSTAILFVGVVGLSAILDLRILLKSWCQFLLTSRCHCLLEILSSTRAHQPY